ncbi:hypothetical protein PCE1_000533 [Barthelona sp. PCE]
MNVSYPHRLKLVFEEVQARLKSYNTNISLSWVIDYFIKANLKFSTGLTTEVLLTEILHQIHTMNTTSLFRAHVVIDTFQLDESVLYTKKLTKPILLDTYSRRSAQHALENGKSLFCELLQPLNDHFIPLKPLVVHDSAGIQTSDDPSWLIEEQDFVLNHHSYSGFAFVIGHAQKDDNTVGVRLRFFDAFTIDLTIFRKAGELDPLVSVLKVGCFICFRNMLLKRVKGPMGGPTELYFTSSLSLNSNLSFTNVGSLFGFLKILGVTCKKLIIEGFETHQTCGECGSFCVSADSVNESQGDFCIMCNEFKQFTNSEHFFLANFASLSGVMRQVIVPLDVMGVLISYSFSEELQRLISDPKSVTYPIVFEQDCLLLKDDRDCAVFADVIFQ